MDFDASRLYYSHQQLQRDVVGAGLDDDDEHAGGNNNYQNEANVNLLAVRRHFREFLRECTGLFVRRQ